ncbi:carbohydrate ABC transporter permease [Clostridium sp.]|uniref:carbohydrate ABC transporter permease n=1 Tax=Clostridium sp. TaxID=1506 RepID=UPI002628A938|nr:sugar ABC transporter permease [uncultured Clostridium sp.]
MQVTRKNNTNKSLNFTKKENLKERLQTYGMILPSFIFLLVFSIYPLVWVLRYMFCEFDESTPAKFIGMGNFVRIFTRDTYFWKTVLNTFIYGGGKILLTIPISFLLALLINEKLKGKDVVRAMIFMPTIISTAVMAMMFYYILNPYNGVLNQILISFHIVSQPINWLGEKYAMLSVILVAVWGAIGNYMIYFIAGLQSIPQEIYESAEIDGANKLQTTWYITIPMLGPVMQIIIMMAITVSLKGYESIMVLTGGGPNGSTDVMFLYVYKLFFPMSDGSDFRTNYGYGATAAFVSAIIVGLITCAYLYYSRKSSEDIQ